MPAAWITFAHFGDLVAHEGGELLRRIPDQDRALARKLVLHLGRVEGGDRGRVELGDDRRRRLGRGDHAVPVVGLDLGIAEFWHGRQVRQRRHLHVATHRQRLDLAGLNLRQQHRNVGEHDLELVADEIVHRRRRAAIGHMDDVDTGIDAQ